MSQGGSKREKGDMEKGRGVYSYVYVSYYAIEERYS